MYTEQPIVFEKMVQLYKNQCKIPIVLHFFKNNFEKNSKTI